MTVPELVIWSASVGAIAVVVLVGLADAILLRRPSALQGPAYTFASLIFVVALSGLPAALDPTISPHSLQVAQVLVGPLCVLLGDNWIRGWLAAEHRDRLMDLCLRAAGTIAPVAGIACLLLPTPQQLPVVALLVVANSGLVLWMTVRARMLGDSLAAGIAMGCLFMVPSVGGLYAMALGLPGIGIGVQAFIAVVTVLCVTFIGVMLWKRNQHARRVRGFEPVMSQFDPVTKLPGGLPFVRELHKAQERRRRTQRDGALIAVILYQPEAVTSQAGSVGLNEFYLQIAQRLQRQVGVVNPVGRYWDRCFVVLVETIHSPAAMRTLGLRVASSLRKPVHVNALDGGTLHARPDIGVGIVHLGRTPEAVEDLLHEAQELAEAARAMRSRAAVRDPVSGQVMPVENAQLGGKRHRRPTHVPHPVSNLGALRARS